MEVDHMRLRGLKDREKVQRKIVSWFTNFKNGD
jgi:hypothetical protein